MTSIRDTSITVRRLGVVALALAMFTAGAAAGAMRTNGTSRRLAELIMVCYHTKVSEWECPDTGPDTSASASSLDANGAKLTLVNASQPGKNAQKKAQLPPKRPSASRGSTASVYDDQITSIMLTLKTSTNRTIVRDVPITVDAIFLTKPSTRKFLLRYYRDTNAVDKAARLEARLGKAP